MRKFSLLDRTTGNIVLVGLFVVWALVSALLLSSCAAHSIDTVVAKAKLIPWHEANYTPVGGVDAAPLLAKLLSAAKHLGVAVVFDGRAPMAGLAGFLTVTPGDGSQTPGDAGLATFQIAIDESFPPNTRLEVLSHELGHMFHPQSSALRKDEREVFAELVGVTVQRRMGYYRGHDSSARYLAAYKIGLPVADLYRVEIEEAATIILAHVEAPQP